MVDEILSQPMPEFDGRSIIDLLDAVKIGLDFSLYVGFTEQQIQKEAFAFMGRRGANRPKKKNGEKPPQRPVLLRGDRCAELLSAFLSFFYTTSLALIVTLLVPNGTTRRSQHTHALDSRGACMTVYVRSRAACTCT